VIEGKYNVLKEKLKNPKIYTDNIISELQKHGNNVLNSIINEYPNKIIYIDFWSTICKPCIEEFRYSRNLYDKYIGKDIIFVYIASNCSDKDWKDAVVRHNLKGKHLLLNKEQARQISDKLNLSGIPHYILIDGNGIIVNSNAPRPSEAEKLSMIIDNLLKSNN
jgi:thiol-disulfide isomerase/thioredoxin